MIPIHDEIKARRVPYVNYILIVINVVVFIFEFMSGPRLEALITEYALVPAQLTVWGTFGICSFTWRGALWRLSRTGRSIQLPASQRWAPAAQSRRFWART